MLSPNQAIIKAYQEQEQNNKYSLEDYIEKHDGCPICEYKKTDMSCYCHIRPPCSFCVCEHTDEDLEEWISEN